jgi:hypothetical protein
MEETSTFEMPYHLQFALRKAEIEAKELTWDQMLVALLNLYHQRLLEIQAIKDLLAEENIDIEFDVPTEVEMIQLLAGYDLDEDDGFQELA